MKKLPGKRLISGMFEAKLVKKPKIPDENIFFFAHTLPFV